MMSGNLFACRHAWFALLAFILWASISAVVAQKTTAAVDAAPAEAAQVEIPVVAAISAELQPVETLYRFSLSEGGDLPVIRRAQSMLNNNSVAELSPEERTLRNDVQIEADIMRSRLIGMFPLTRFVTATPFSANTVRARYELLEKPELTAVAEARNKLIQDPRLAAACDVLVVSTGEDQKLNQEIEETSHSDLALTRRFFPVTGRRTTDIDDQLKNFDGRPTSSLPSSLAGIRPLLLVLVHEKCVEQDLYHYEVNGYLFNDPQGKPTEFETLVQEGFSVKRNDVMWSVLALTVLLLAAAPFLYRGLVRLTAHTKRAPSWGNSFLMGTLGFVFGLAFIWGIAPMVAKTRPGELLPAWTSFWWPAMVGAAYVLGPATVFYFAEGRFKWLGASFETFNRGGAIFAIIALGSATYLVQSSLHYAGWSAWWIVPPLLTASSMTALVVGRAMDKTE
jgi:hypothetical protein